ncbi:hypothetical protein BGV66_01310 [Burkholderia ubonensis]|uniref:Uncharacterized protein n=1 Tax=Burkholderia ubonensis TaxID=101571 RepID=A0ABD6QAW7_9BURK|nr:hypothetical protein BGV66_01310 [Burkholderia ubonensis]
MRLVALDTLAERFDVEFVYDGHAVSPVVRQFLAALHATAGARTRRCRGARTTRAPRHRPAHGRSVPPFVS